MKRAILAATLMCAAIIPIGCKTASAPPAPLVTGAVNQFDQDSYKALLAVQASLNSLNASYKANPTALASIRPALDQAAVDYNAAIVLWNAYHAAATAANYTSLNTALTKVQLDVSNVKP